MPSQIEMILFLSLIVSALSIGILVLVKNPNSIVNRSFSLFLFGVAALVAGFLFLHLQFSFWIFDSFVHFGGLTFLLGIFLFCQVFPDRKKLPWKRWSLYIPFIFFYSVVPFHLIIRTATFGSDGSIVPVNGPLYMPYLLFAVIYFSISFYYLIYTYRTSSGRQKVQMEYLFVGMAILAFSMVFFNMFLPALGITSLYVIGPASSIAVIVLTAISIVRHNLMDIRIVIQRGLIYLILLAIVAGIYIFGLQALGYLLHQLTDTAGFISAGVTMVLGIFFFHTVEEFFENITDPLFFKSKYNYAEALHQLSKVLHTNVAQADVVSASIERLQAIFRPQWVRFRLAEDGEIENKPGSEAVLSMPIIFEDKCLGMLELGAKRSGDGYNSRDIKLLETFVYQAAVALEKGRLYERVMKYSTELEQLVTERTTEIRQLQEDQRHTMIDISHNLQTPLAIIKGELEMLRESSSEPEKMEVVKKSLMRISGFIRQLLHLARLEHSAHNVELSPCNISTILRNQVEYFEVMAEQEGVTITSKIPKNRYMIQGNKRLLEELFTNLVINAIKYRRADIESTVHISLTETNETIEISVKDNGIGIAPEHLQDIFTRFHRASNENAHALGSGLGLAIVKKIVDRHNGTIIASSIVGQETEFKIIFPKIGA